MSLGRFPGPVQSERPSLPAALSMSRKARFRRASASGESTRRMKTMSGPSLAEYSGAWAISDTRSGPSPGDRWFVFSRDKGTSFPSEADCIIIGLSMVLQIHSNIPFYKFI